MIYELAQAAPTVPGGLDPTAWLGQIAQTGLMGLLFVLVVYALVRRDRELSEERKARLEDAKALLTSIKADTEAKAAATSAREASNRLIETLIRNQDAMTAKMDLAYSCLREKKP